MYKVIYDYYDEDFGTTTLTDLAETYEQAVSIKEDLLEYDNYSNIQIVDEEDGY